MLTITASVSSEIRQNVRIFFVSFRVKVTCKGVFLPKMNFFCKFFLNLTESVDQSLLDGLLYLLPSLKLFSEKKSVLLKLPHLITLLPRLHQSNEIHFVTSWWALITKGRCNTLCSNDISLNVTLISTACHCIVSR